MADKPDDRPGSQENRKQRPAYDVFVSYSHSDRQIAEILARKLQERGLSTFFDRENATAVEDWNDQLQEAIDTSRSCLVLVSKKTDPASPWISKEWAMIQDSIWRRSNLSVCPVLLDDVATPAFLQRWQGIRLSRNSQDIEEAARDISAAIRQNPAERVAASSERDTSATAARFSEIADTLKGYPEAGD